MEIVLATQNLNKIKEIKAILGPAIRYKTLSSSLAIKEVGRTLMENSLLKAEFAFKITGKPALADDSGLFVDALAGAPGIYSARYAQSDKARIDKLLKKLRNFKKRTAKFKAVFVYYYALGKYEVFEAECSGSITNEPRGTSGFGYDPIFVPRGYKKTFAELGPEIKNRISHRAKALMKFRKWLRTH